MNLNKTLFARDQIPFLGFLITRRGVMPDPQKIRSIQEIPEPKSRKELQSFLGVCGYYSRFQVHYAGLINDFRELLCAKKRFVWNETYRMKFETAKARFLDCIILRHYFTDRAFRLQTDASKSGISAILYQFDDEGKEAIVALVSRCLTSYEGNYSATELELLAIVFAFLRLRTFLIGNKFHIVTDQRAITFLLRTPYQSSRLVRWSLIMQEYSFEIKHCCGRDNIVADYFSRVFSGEGDESCDVVIRKLSYSLEGSYSGQSYVNVNAVDRIDL